MIRNLKQVIEWRGKPIAICCDNGTEYISGVLQAWAEPRGIALLYFPPGNPKQDDFAERFDRTVSYAWLASSLTNHI